MAEVKIRLRALRCEDGAQLVEFALVLPLLLLVVLGIAEFGFMFNRYEVITNAAREGARIAILPRYDTVDVRARVTAYLDAGGIPVAGRSPAQVTDTSMTVTVGTAVTTIPMKRVQVNYTHTYMFIPNLGSWFGSSYTTQQLIAVAEMRREGS